MKIIRKVEFKPGSYEEELPGISAEFPYIASYVELDKCAGRQSPWHWHKEAELFYMEQGSLEYDTPHGKTVFTAGSGGFVNSNVLLFYSFQVVQGKVLHFPVVIFKAEVNQLPGNFFLSHAL